jgi:NDP-sugar pyrophosphorylase family protein
MGAGVTEVILASGHLHDVLYERVGEVYAGMRIRYAKEEKRLGTGGAIQNAMKQVNASPFFVLNGDILLANFSLQEMLDRFHEGMAGVLLSMHVSDIRPYGEIVSDSDGRVQAFREKQPTCRAGYVNGAIYLFDKSIAKAFPMGQDVFSLERDVFPYLSNLYALQTDADWIDIGVPERLAYAREHFSSL